ncbi:myb-like protein X [Senna tora]|uniref:Myb-like protein X n=1 Tax=Senna tora TaxID=362788 RepID=A0A834SPG0_9FABA|nr:myb-like protein X [Senna tora]
MSMISLVLLKFTPGLSMGHNGFREKNREKKHKKEKRDKGKWENKEKGEKEGRDGKHKEKKDKKQKHREKKKDKDRDRDKDNNDISTPDEKVFPAQAEGHNSGKHNKKEIKQKDKKGLLFVESFTKQYTENNGERARGSNHLAEENKDSKFLLELGRRIKDEDGGAGNQLVQSFTIADHRKDEGALRLVAKGSSIWPDGKEKLVDKSIDANKIDGQGIRANAQPIANAYVHNHAENFQPRVVGMPRSMEKSLDRTVETTVDGKEKVKEKKDDKQGDKRKDKEKEKKGHGKNKDRDKEKKKEEKVKQQTEHKNTEQNKLEESYKGGAVGINSSAHVPRNSHENAANGDYFKKRKDIESNGVLHANDNWPSKLPRSSSHPYTENGRILEPCQISIPYASDKMGAASKLKVDNKEGKKNGIIEVQPSTILSKKNTTVILPADPVAEASSKPPHPDSKYLSQVYSVPKMEEWLDVDNQEWLFGSSCSQERKPRVESSEARESQQVWAEALHIDSADVYALPYVIPY